MKNISEIVKRSIIEFANEPAWKEKLNPDTLKKVSSIIADYEEANARLKETIK